jgi:peroxiredoxin family protein
MLGMGPVFFKSLMKKNHVETLPDLIDMAQEMSIRMVACEMSMDIMGIKKNELLDGIEYGGVATYLGDASDSKITLFI